MSKEILQSLASFTMPKERLLSLASFTVSKERLQSLASVTMSKERMQSLYLFHHAYRKGGWLPSAAKLITAQFAEDNVQRSNCSASKTEEICCMLVASENSVCDSFLLLKSDMSRRHSQIQPI